MSRYEMPDGSWDMEREDADYQMAALEEVGRRASRLKKKGVCVHGSSVRNLDGTVTCREPGCGKVFASQEELLQERDRLLGY